MAPTSPTSDAEIGSGTSPVAVSQTLEGLEDGNYHYRVVATNAEGTTAGSDHEFLIDNRPLLYPEAASSVKSGSATLNGKVNPQAFTSTYQFEYATNAFYKANGGYEEKVPVPAAGVGSGIEDVTVANAIEELEPETTYHFRLVGSNVKGTRYSEDKTFRSGAVPPVYESTLTIPGEIELSAPHGAAVDASGDLWVVDDYRDHVLKFNSKGEYQSYFGSSDLEGKKVNGKFFEPIDVAVTAGGDLWVSDSQRNRLQKFNSKGEYLSKIEPEALSSGQLDHPAGIAIDSAGNIWVANKWENNVKEFSSGGTYIRTVGKAGTGNGEFNEPEGIAVDAEDHVWVADTGNNRIQQFSNSGSYISKFGSIGNPAGYFVQPQAIEVKPSGDLLIVDHGNEGAAPGRVQQFTTAGEYVTQFGKGTMEYPEGVALASDGAVYVTSTYNKIGVQKWQHPYPTAITSAAEGVTAFQAKLAGTVNPRGLTTTYRFEYGTTTAYGTKVPVPNESVGSGTTAVAVSKSAVELKPQTTYHYRLRATSSNGTTYSKDQTFKTKPVTVLYESTLTIPGEIALSGPHGAAVDASGNLWVVDDYRDHVLKFNSKGEYQSYFGSSDLEGKKVNGKFFEPIDVAVTAGGDLWVSDSQRNRLQKFNSKGEYLSKIEPEALSSGQLNHPAGIAIDSAGNIWVANKWENNVKEFSSGGSFIRTVGGTKAGTGNGEFKEPEGIAVDAEGHVWVADTGNNRIQEFSNSGSYMFKFGSIGNPAGYFVQPRAIEIKPSGDLLIVDHGNEGAAPGRVQQFTTAGEFVSQFGKGTMEYPEGIALASDGAVYVTSTYNKIGVQKWVETMTPKTTTQAASSLTGAGAKLNAAVNPHGLATTYYFEYGTTTAYGTKAPTSPASIGSGFADVSVSQTLSGLSSNTTYHFRVVAENSEGTSYGKDESFTTPKPPKATSEAATSIKSIEATLNGAVNPEGTATSYYFEYGTTTGYGSKAPTSPKAAGSGTESVKVNETAKGLSENTTYHFRLVAESAGGTNYGADKTFTTEDLHWTKGGSALAGSGTLSLGGSFNFTGEIGTVSCEGAGLVIEMEGSGKSGHASSFAVASPSSCTATGLIGTICGKNSLTSASMEGKPVATIAKGKSGSPVIEIQSATLVYKFGSCLTIHPKGNIIATPDNLEKIAQVTFSGELMEPEFEEVVTLSGTMAAAPASLSLKGALAFTGEIGGVSCAQTTTAANFESSGQISSFSVSEPSSCTVTGSIGTICGKNSLTAITMEGKPAAKIVRTKAGNPAIEIQSITLATETRCPRRRSTPKATSRRPPKAPPSSPKPPSRAA